MDRIMLSTGVNGSDHALALPGNRRVRSLHLQVHTRFLFTYLFGPVDPSSRAFSGRLKFTVRRHKFNKDYLQRCQEIVVFVHSTFRFILGYAVLLVIYDSG